MPRVNQQQFAQHNEPILTKDPSLLERALEQCAQLAKRIEQDDGALADLRLPYKLVKSIAGHTGLTHEGLPELRRYVPNLLGWSTVQEVAQDLGVHRNWIVSTLRLKDRQKCILYSGDQRLYISPEGTRFVRQEFKKSKRVYRFPTLQDLAKDLEVPPRNLAAVLSIRKIDPRYDRSGLRRIPPDVERFLRAWRGDVDAKQSPPAQKVVKDTTYRSVESTAAECADIFAWPKGPEHARLHNSFKDALTHRLRRAVRLGRASDVTPPRDPRDPWYLREDDSRHFVECVSVVGAARLIDVAIVTIKNWSAQFELKRRYAGSLVAMPKIDLTKLLILAAKKYDNEVHLLDREGCPTFGIAFALHQVMRRAGVDEAAFLERSDIPPELAEILRKRVCIEPRKTYRQLIDQVSSLLACANSLGEILSYATSDTQTPPEFRIRLARYLAANDKEQNVVTYSAFRSSLQRAAEARRVDTEKLYTNVVQHFLRSAQPKIECEFKDLQRHRTSLFPLQVAVFLDYLADPARSLFWPGAATAPERPGGLYFNPETDCFGIVESFHSNEFFVRNPISDDQYAVDLTLNPEEPSSKQRQLRG